VRVAGCGLRVDCNSAKNLKPGNFLKDKFLMDNKLTDE